MGFACICKMLIETNSYYPIDYSYHAGGIMNRFRLKVLLMLSVLTLILTSDVLAQTVIRVNCGGGAYRDRFGNDWSSDQKYRPGSWGHVNGGYSLIYPYSIKGTVDDPLYQAERNALDFYRFTVPNGNYVVQLKFAELYYKKVGQRIYHVSIEGKRVMQDFDMFATAGFARAIDRTFQVTVNDGRLDIFFETIYTAPGISIAHSNVKAISVEEQGSQDARLWIDKNELKFGKKTFSRTFEIKNGGAKPLNWNLFENPDEPWIKSVLPANGTLLQNEPQQIEIKVSRSGLTEGDYEGKISIQSNGGDKNVKVIMRVENDFPIPEIKPAELAFGSVLTKRHFVLKNVGTAPLDWSMGNAGDIPWVADVEPSEGVLSVDESQTVTVTIDRNLAAGPDEAFLEIITNGDNENLKLTLDDANDPLRVNCGGEDYVDIADNLWLADIGFSDGYSTTYALDIMNTFDDVLYQDVCAEMTKYQFAVQENGFYHVSLHFAESELTEPEQRIFHVLVEDSLVLQNFDMNAETDPQNAIVKACDIGVEDGVVDIAFVPVSGVPQISAVELFKIPDEPFLSVQPNMIYFGEGNTEASVVVGNMGAGELMWKIQPPEATWLNPVDPDSGTLAYNESDSIPVSVSSASLVDGIYEATLMITSNGGSAEIPVSYQVGMVTNYNIRVNAGGDQYIDSEEQVWEADKPYSSESWGYIGGETYSTRLPIVDTNEDPLYRSERWGMESYLFDAPNGNYEVVLHFAEIYVKKAGRRVFGVNIEDEPVIQDLDIFAEVGKKAAMSMAFQVSVLDNQLNIDFVRGLEDPKISAIEVLGNNNIATMESDPSSFDVMGSGVIPDHFHLNQNYPNPFNMSTNISFGLPVESDVTLEIYNLMGQRQLVLFEGVKEAGYHHADWNGLDMYHIPVASGFYVYRIHVSPHSSDYSPYVDSRKMLLLK